MTIQKRDVLTEGKSKILYASDHPDGHLIQHFKDDATAFNGEKKGHIHDKGAFNNQISSWIFEFLENQGIATHFVDQLGEREMLVKRVTILPVEVVVRNFAAGSLCKRLGLERGKVLDPPLLEYFYKSDALGDPLISENHVLYFKWATAEQLTNMAGTALKVNYVLSQVFDHCDLKLVDFKLEFGQDPEGNLLLADEVTLDGCRLWDKESGESMDKDRFRFDMGRVEESYSEVHRRLREALKEKKS